MKCLILITESKITPEHVSNKILDSYKWTKVISRNDASELFVGVSPNEFYIIFDDAISIHDPKSLFDKSDIDKIPLNDPYINGLLYRNEEIAKYVVGIIINEYPELYVCDEDGCIMSGKKYLGN